MKITDLLLGGVLVALVVLIVQQSQILAALNPSNYGTGWETATGSELLRSDSKFHRYGYAAVAPVKEFLGQEFVMQLRYRK